MLTRAILTSTVIASLLALPWEVRGADNKAPGTADADIRLKSEQIERLKAELLRAEQELRMLQGAAYSNEPAPFGIRSESGTSPRLAGELPPLSAETVVSVDELSAYYRADPAMAHARYGGKTFLIEGSVTRFEPKFGRRSYDLILEPSERSPIVIGQFAYLESYRAVYTRENGQVLVARVGEHQESSLFRVGDRVRIRARCAGIRDGAIHVTRCKIVED